MRCGCAGASDCACALDGNGIDVSGIGSARDPYVLTLDINKGVNDCVALTGTGTAEDPLTAAPIISDAAGNGLKCTPKGLYVPSGVNVAGTETGKADCIKLAGTGTAEDPLTAAPILDPRPDNALQCGPSGLYVPNGEIEEESESEESGTPPVRSVRYADLYSNTCQRIGGGDEYHLVRFPYDDTHDDDPYGWHEPDNHPDGHVVTDWAADDYSALVYPSRSGWCQLWASIEFEAGDYTEIRAQFVTDPLGDAATAGTNHWAPSPGKQCFTMSWAMRVTKGVPLALRVAHNDDRARCLTPVHFKLTVQP